MFFCSSLSLSSETSAVFDRIIFTPKRYFLCLGGHWGRNCRYRPLPDPVTGSIVTWQWRGHEWGVRRQRRGSMRESFDVIVTVDIVCCRDLQILISKLASTTFLSEWLLEFVLSPGLRFLRMMRWEGRILLDLTFLTYITVEMKTVTKTMIIMTPLTKPRKCMGFSLLFNKKDVKGPLSWVCKRAQREIKSIGLKDDVLYASRCLVRDTW